MIDEKKKFDYVHHPANGLLPEYMYRVCNLWSCLKVSSEEALSKISHSQLHSLIGLPWEMDNLLQCTERILPRLKSLDFINQIH